MAAFQRVLGLGTQLEPTTYKAMRPPRPSPASPGRVRLRLINAAADTAFRVALRGHRLTVTHTDGYPVVPFTTEGLTIGMGERFDGEVTLADGLCSPW